MISSFSRRLHSFLLLSLLIPQFCAADASVAPIATQDSVAQPNNLSAEISCAATSNAILDELLSAALHQTELIDALLEELALVSNNNAHLTKEQRSALTKEIRTLRKTLGEFKKISFTSTSPQELYILLTINKELSAHLETSLAQGFTILKPFSLETHVTRGIKEQNITLEKLATTTQENEVSLKNLEKTAQSVGLTWYNKVYRGFDWAVMQPLQKYHVVQRGAVVLGVAAVAIGAWWLFTDRGEVLRDSNKNIIKESGTTFEQWLRELLGPRPLPGKIRVNRKTGQPVTDKEYDHGAISAEVAQSAINESELKLVGNITAHYGPLSMAASAIGGVLCYAQKDISNTKAWFYKKWVDSINRLKGGAFATRTVNTSPEGMAKEPTCTFDDIIGSENAKEILSGIIQYLISPEKFDMAKITPEKGYLFTGQTRTGKSFMAEAVAGELRKELRELGKDPDAIKFYPVDATTIQEVGIKNILAVAKKMAPCILFIDEIDLLQLQRAGGNSTLLSDFLVGLSNFSLQDPDKQVILLAATNRSENLDEALKRRGRFGVEIRFSYPSYSHRKEFFAHKLEDIGVTIEDLNLDSLAEQTYGKSYDDLNAILKKALQQAKAEHCTIDQDLLERAIDSEIFWILPHKDYPLSAAERHLVASSIAGQILINHLLDTSMLSLKATINPYMPKLHEQNPLKEIFTHTENKKQDLIKYGSIFSANKYEFLTDTYSSEQLSNVCKMLLAGRCAQKLLLGITSHDAEAVANMQNSYKLAKNLVSKGIEGAMLSDKMRDTLADKAFALVETFEQETTTLLEQHKEQLEHLVAALLKFGTLNRDELSMVIDGKHAKPLSLPRDSVEPSSIINQPAVA